MRSGLRGERRRRWVSFDAFRDDSGSVTAEFAVTVPAVLLVLGLVIGGIQLSTHRLTLVSAAAEIARLEARGDHAMAADRIRGLGDVRIERTSDSGILCVSLTAAPDRGLLALMRVDGRGCAAITEAAS